MRHQGRVRATAFSLALAVLLLTFLPPKGTEAATWDESYFPNHEVVDQNGRSHRFYDDLIDDKIVAINFVYTGCPDLCSLGTARMAELKEHLGDRLGKDIFFISITIDPENDTPNVLKTYAEAFGVEDGWFFLTGDPAELDEIGHKLGERSRKLTEHRNDLVLGNGATAEWRRFSLMSDISTLSERVLEMDPVWRNQKRDLSNDRQRSQGTSFKLDDRPGEALYLKACVFCHTIGGEERIGPDLAGVTERRDRDWLTRFIMAPDFMIQKEDPLALELDEHYPGVVMPNLGLTRDDAGDIIAYLEMATERLERRRASFDLTNHRGEAVTEATYHGQHLLVYFGYSFCPDLCPMGLQTMATAYDLLSDDEKVSVQPIFITLDPERDTAETMADYVPFFHEDLVGLTGTAEETAKLASTFDVYFDKRSGDSSPDDYLVDHSSAFHLVGPDGGYIRRFDHDVPEEEMSAGMRQILSKDGKAY
jgi:cytochrome oxidase Cu insertion factor (SCO1/SenC/PrrC family)